MSSPTPVRFPPQIDQATTDFAQRAGLPKSRVVIRGMDEWLRMQAHPRIRFVQTNTGERRAALLTGPQVWTVAASWLQHQPAERDATTIADAIGLSLLDVEAALSYWAEYRTEIDQLVDRHVADQEAALTEWEQRQALRDA